MDLNISALQTAPEKRCFPFPTMVYWDFIKDYADEQYAESCKEWSAFAEHKCAGLSEANKKYLADIFEKASLLELAFWKMAYRNERMEENAK